MSRNLTAVVHSGNGHHQAKLSQVRTNRPSNKLLILPELEPFCSSKLLTHE